MESTSINEGTVVLSVKDPAFHLDAGVLRKMVYDGGATLSRVAVEGSGRLVEEDGAWTWIVAGSGQRIAVRFAQGAEDLRAAARAASGRDVALEGSIDVPKGTEPFAPVLLVTRLR